MAVPYVGGALEAQIVDIIRTGTCVQLDQFRCSRSVALPPRGRQPLSETRRLPELSTSRFPTYSLISRRHVNLEAKHTATAIAPNCLRSSCVRMR